MLGIVTALGLDHPVAGADNNSATPPADSAENASSPTQVVIGRLGSAGTTPTASSAPPPIVLAPNPVVRTVNSSSTTAAPAPPAPPPVATTRGSG